MLHASNRNALKRLVGQDVIRFVKKSSGPVIPRGPEPSITLKNRSTSLLLPLLWSLLPMLRLLLLRLFVAAAVCCWASDRSKKSYLRRPSDLQAKSELT